MPDTQHNPPTGAPTPTVSIGLPVYNGEAYLRACLDSILAQTFADFELVVCDNCSTDTTPEIVAEYAWRDPRVRYVRNERNLGSNGNFNRVYEHCTGRYFKWQSYDDLLDPAYLERAVAALDADGSVVLAHCRTDIIDANDQPVASGIDPFHELGSHDRVRRFRSALRDLFCYDIYGLMRRSALDRTHLMVDFRGGDKTLLCELSLLGRFHRDEAGLFLRRVHPDMSGAMTGAQKRRQSQFKARVPYRLKAFAAYFGILGRHGVRGWEKLRCQGEILKMGMAYHRWYKLLVPGPSNYFGINGPGKPDAGVAGEGGLLVRLEEASRRERLKESPREVGVRGSMEPHTQAKSA